MFSYNAYIEVYVCINEHINQEKTYGRNYMSDIKNTITKVQGLLKLAAGSTNENEVKAATAAADRIMQEHRITQAQVEAQDSTKAEPMVSLVISEGGRRTAWREVLLQSLTNHYGSAWYLSSYRRGGEEGQRGRKGSKGVQVYVVVGRESDTKIVDYMFKHLEAQTERLCKWHAGGKGVKYALAWLMGCAMGIRAQFDDMTARARAQAQGPENTSAALVLLDKRGQEAKEHMQGKIGTRSATAISGAQDYEARNEGYGVGKKVEIKQGLGGCMQVPKLA